LPDLKAICPFLQQKTMCVMEEADGGLMARPPGPERVQWLSDRNLIDLLLLGSY